MFHKTFTNSSTINNISEIDENIENFENKEHLEQLQQQILNILTDNEKKICLLFYSPRRYTRAEISIMLDCSTQYISRILKQIRVKVKTLGLHM